MIKKIKYYWESYKIQKEKDSINKDIDCLQKIIKMQINELRRYGADYEDQFLSLTDYENQLNQFLSYENQYLSLKKRADKYDDYHLFFLTDTIKSLKEKIEKNSQIAKKYGLKKANSQQYKHWLRKYIDAGYKPTHFYNGNYTDESLYIATKDFEVPALCGSSSLCIIIPKGIKFTQPKNNHCSFYYEDSELIGKSGSFIPCYGNIYT
jgi:hypothetical protein